MKLSRRKLLVGAAAGGGLIAAYALLPRDYPVPLPAGEGENAFNAWIKIARTGVVTVAVPQLEMGQGATTIIPRIAAEELGADWRQVAVEPAAISPAYADPVLAAHWAGLRGTWLPSFADDPDDFLAKNFASQTRLMATAAGTGIAAYEMAIREAAAGVRAVLAMAAAERWGVAFEECEAQAGFIVHGEKELRFGELADDAALLSPPSPAVLRPDPPSDNMPDLVDGAAVYPRLDGPSKVDGSFRFAGDIRLPEMVHAAIAHGPLASATLSGFNETAARTVTGYIARVEGKGWLAAIGSSRWAAEKALERMKPQFKAGRELPDSAAIMAALDNALENGEPEVLSEVGQSDVALEGLGVYEARYTMAPALHGTIETTSATARFTDGRLELWMAAQAPEQAREEAAAAVGLTPDKVVLYPVGAGGSFDARLDHRIAREVAAITKAIKRPVQLSYSRRQEHLTALPRPPMVAKVRGIIGPNGTIHAWHARTAAQAGAREMFARLFDGQTPEEAHDAAAGLIDPANLSGMAPPYAIPNLKIESVSAETNLPAGRMRGNAEARACFVTESFLDEMARQAGEEPLGWRIAMLGNNPRLFECLQGVAQLGEWDGGSDGSAQGLACWQMPDPAGQEGGGGTIAVIVRARPGENGVDVSSISAWCDIGRIVHYDIAAQQIEGGLIFGLNAALGLGVTYDSGMPRERTLADLRLNPLGRTPEISVGFAQSDAPPFDPGELGMVAVAPALCNALRSATGNRFRDLPIPVGQVTLAPAPVAETPATPTDGESEAAVPEPEPSVLPDGSVAED
ncbi:molybdopterin cofactor-binding domain-containing protein [Croceicoccus naphthovorans]|uniref:molybdopterin cofactor-binding domain-containing protein n=1 Tax=Croceicoccus naphthovorans TaxID=1348774 RepID=UPI0009E627FF|nr:molybdopterin cofactor-binding domain-containing protein [Croceicoccus naphthovorans]MBB3989203.1 isoquinoline 1-oxidoreductase beta subunit [Croceicoccus naphthovorans]